jgi:hypothetical protein
MHDEQSKLVIKGQIAEARQSIIEAAARLTGQGVDTSAITRHFVDLEERLAELARLEREAERLGSGGESLN